jgi:hypothetical protein
VWWSCIASAQAADEGSLMSIGRVMDQLASPRNDAVHAGKDLVKDTAIGAVRTARELVRAVSPLPAPRSAAILGRLRVGH